MSALEPDVCRCHDDGCAKRYRCARWLERDNGGPRTPHSWSLYQEADLDGANLSGVWPVPCDYYLEVPHG